MRSYPLMGGKIPEPIRRKVIRQWLDGLPRQQIARDNQIGTGTVSEIIKEVKEHDSEAQIDVLRETAVMLRRQGLNINFFARSIRLKRMLDEIGLNEEQLEDFAVHLNVHCFKRGLTPDAFMNVVASISFLSDNLGVPVVQLPRYITRGKTLLENLNLEIVDVKIKQKRVIANYNVTMTDLEEFRRNKPLQESLKAKDIELKSVRKRMNYLEGELIGEQTKREISEYDCFVSEHEMKLVNKELEQPIEVTELSKLAKDLLHHPSKYSDILRTMRQRSELQSTSSNG
jgi:hypothetical protein